MGIYRFDIWDTEKVIAGFTADYSGFFHYNRAGDVPHYAAVGKTASLEPERMVRVHQYHTDRVAAVDASNGGEGILREGPEEGADAMVTDTGELMLCIISADCVPVFLYDELNRAIGLAHSGRIGTGKEIALNTVLRMRRQYGSEPGQIRCILGPHLCSRHHDVHAEDLALFNERFTEAERDRFITFADETAYVDMGAAIELSLLRAGLRRENIYNCGICTYENPELYSWRRDENPDTHILSFLSLILITD